MPQAWRPQVPPSLPVLVFGHGTSQVPLLSTAQHWGVLRETSGLEFLPVLGLISGNILIGRTQVNLRTLETEVLCSGCQLQLPFASGTLKGQYVKSV